MKTLNPYEIRAVRKKPKPIGKRQQKMLLKQLDI